MKSMIKLLNVTALAVSVLFTNYTNAAVPPKGSPLNVLAESGGSAIQQIFIKSMDTSQIQSGFVITFMTDASHHPDFSKTCKDSQAYNTTLDQASILLSATIAELPVDVVVKPDDDGNCKILMVGMTSN